MACAINEENSRVSTARSLGSMLTVPIAMYSAWPITPGRSGLRSSSAVPTPVTRPM